jgi:hypothetical protein
MGSKGIPLPQQNTLERAFTLAQASQCQTIAEIRVQLKREQHESVDAHLAGPCIQRQLRQIIATRVD